jgi:hypothetical protein
VLFRPGLHDRARRTLTEAARAGKDLDENKAVRVRVVEYTVPGRDGDGKDELIALITTIGDPAAVSAQPLAEAYHQRWEHERSEPQCCHSRGWPASLLAPSGSCWSMSRTCGTGSAAPPRTATGGS